MFFPYEQISRIFLVSFLAEALGLRYNKAIANGFDYSCYHQERVTCSIMYKILKKKALNPTVTLMEIEG
ncbi:MAG: hypothetical protein ACLUUJ_05065, partial [Acutalibacteraceae bacterium]